MARERIIEGTWKCTSCEHGPIPGSVRVCPECGNPREDEEAKFDFGATDASGRSAAATVTDTTKLTLAAAGADWYCGNCGTANIGTAQSCKSCGNGDPDNRLAKKPDKPKIAPVVAPPPPSGSAAKGAAGLGAGCMALLVLGGVLLLCVVGGWVIFGKTEDQGKVTAMHWTREMAVEEFAQVSGKTGWKSDIPKVPTRMPVNGAGEQIGADNVRLCVTKEKTPKKCENKTVKEQCGTEEKCHKQDLGNGFAKEVCDDVPKYCDKQVEDCKPAVVDDFCTYDTWEWKQKTTTKVEGADNAPTWPPEPPHGNLERVLRKESYMLDVEYDGNKGQWAPPDEKTYRQFSVGAPAVVVSNKLGITEVKPAR